LGGPFRFRKELEDTGMGYGKKIEALEIAAELASSH